MPITTRQEPLSSIGEGRVISEHPPKNVEYLYVSVRLFVRLNRHHMRQFALFMLLALATCAMAQTNGTRQISGKTQQQGTVLRGTR
jgi:hypothetical protein